MVKVDVVVVGAGLAGMSVARKLVDDGYRVRVVEARDRVGGRTLSVSHQGAVFEHGAQWISPHQTRVSALVKELGLTPFPQYHHGTKVVDLHGDRSTYEGRIPSLSWLTLIQTEIGLRRLDHWAKQVPLDDPGRAPKAEAWGAMTVETARARLIKSQGGRRMFDLAVRTVMGAEPSQLSLLYFLFYVHAAGGFQRLIDIPDGAQQLRLVEGTQSMCLRLAERIGAECLMLDTPVRRVEQSADEVVVRAGEVELTARRAVIAIPPHLAGRLDFAPGLPPLRDQMLQRWAMGATTKVIACYPEATWRGAGLSGEAIATGAAISCLFDNSAHDGSVSALLGFIVGDAARRFNGLPKASRRQLALSEIERLVGAPARSAAHYDEMDWLEERFTGGCPTASLPTGSLGAFGGMWRAPFGRIHWAGTETARYWNGYLEGALESAERVHREICATHLQPPRT